MSSSPYIARDTHRARPKDKDFYSGPRRRRRRGEPEPVETIEQKIHRRALRFWELVQQNSREAIAIAAGVVLIVSAVVWFFVNQAKQEREAWARLSQASNVAKRAAYQAMRPNAPPTMADPVRQYERVVDDFSGTEAAPFARFQLGRALMERGAYERAGKAYEQAVAERPKGVVGYLGRMGQAAALEGQRRYNEAAQALAAMVSEKACPAFLKIQIELDCARCLDSAGKTEDAEKHYRSVLKQTTDDDLKALVQYRLDRIVLGPSLPPERPAPRKAGRPAPSGAPGPQAATATPAAVTPTPSSTTATPAPAPVTPAAKASTPTSAPAPSQPKPPAAATTTPAATKTGGPG